MVIQNSGRHVHLDQNIEAILQMNFSLKVQGETKKRQLYRLRAKALTEWFQFYFAR